MKPHYLFLIENSNRDRFPVGMASLDISIEERRRMAFEIRELFKASVYVDEVNYGGTFWAATHAYVPPSTAELPPISVPVMSAMSDDDWAAQRREDFSYPWGR